MIHIIEVLRRFAGSKTKWEMYEQGQTRRLLWGIVSTPEDIAKNPQLKYQKWLTHVEHPELGESIQYPGTPYGLSETPWAIRRRPPLVGEHNRRDLRRRVGDRRSTGGDAEVRRRHLARQFHHDCRQSASDHG